MDKSALYQYQGETYYVKNQKVGEVFMEICEHDFIFVIDPIKREVKIDFTFCALDMNDYNRIINASNYVGEFDFYEYTEHRRKFLNRLYGFQDEVDDSEPLYTDQSGLRQLGVTFRRPG